MIGHRLNTELSVDRPQTVPDGAGGTTVTMTAVGTVWFQVSQPTPDERMLAQQAGVDLAHVLHTDFGADVRRGDELEGDFPSDVARARVVSAVSDSQSTYLRVEVEAVQAGG